MNNNIESLIGRTIKEISIGKDEHGWCYIKFETEVENIFWGFMGDCCSQAYLDSITGIDNVINKKITTTKEINLGRDEKQTYQGVDDIHGIILSSKRNYSDDVHCLIIYRNSSNGYYEGFVSVTTDFDCDIEFVKLIENYKHQFVDNNSN